MRHVIHCEKWFPEGISESEFSRCMQATRVVNLPKWVCLRVGSLGFPESSYKHRRYYFGDFHAEYDMEKYNKTKGLIYRLRLKVKALFHRHRSRGGMPVFEHTPAPPERTSSNCLYLTPPPCYQKTPYSSDILAILDDKKPMEWVTIQKGASIGKTQSVIDPAVGYIFSSTPTVITLPDGKTCNDVHAIVDGEIIYK